SGLGPATGPRVIWAGRFSHDKRPEYFIELFREALALEPNVEGVMVGAATQSLRARVERDPLLKERLKLVGQFTSTKLAAAIQASDLAVFTMRPSVVGTIFREAMEAHIPIACTLVPEDVFLPLLVQPDEHVTLLDAFAPARAAAELVHALKDPSGLKRK